MRLLFLGDIVGRSAREKVISDSEQIRRRLSLDALLVNAENAASGFGLTPSIADELLRAGVDGITLGNHAFDKREIYSYLAGQPRIVRPANYPAGSPGQGTTKIRLRDGRDILLVNLMGRLFMNPLDDPFRTIDEILETEVLGESVSAIIVDFHAEATSEKQAMGHYLDGRVSLVVGTHTHVPTADYRVLPGGTAYITDLGMCGNYESVIGMESDEAIQRFLHALPSSRLKPQPGSVTLSGIVVETDERTGLAQSITSYRSGGTLSQSIPEALS